MIVTDYNAAGQPVNSRVSTELQVFRAAAPDFWAYIDRGLSELLNAQRSNDGPKDVSEKGNGTPRRQAARGQRVQGQKGLSRPAVTRR